MRPTIKTVLVAILLAVQAQVGTSQPSTSCMPDKSGKAIRYEIDLIDGATPDVSRFLPRDQVQIVFTNKNPFLFDYEFAIAEQVVEEPALSAFLGLFKGVVPGIESIPALTTLIMEASRVWSARRAGTLFTTRTASR